MDAGCAGDRDVPLDRDPILRAGNERRDGRAPARRVADAAIDRWLQASLRDQFDAVIAEPIPATLAEAIRRLGDADAGNNASQSSALPP